MSKSLPAQLVFCLLMAACASSVASPRQPRHFVYVGTSNSRGSEGLYVFEFNPRDQTLARVQVVSERRGPSFQVIHPSRNYLYSVSSHRFTEGGDYGTISAYRIDRQTGMLSLINERPVQGNAHISIDQQGQFAYVSDYGGGSLSVFGVNSDGSLTEALDVVRHQGRSVNPERQAGPHVHSVIPSRDGRFVYASDLGLDRIMIYAVDQSTGKLTPAQMPYVETTPGSAPRHFVVHPARRFAYSVEEIAHSVTAYAVDEGTGGLSRLQRLDLAPVDRDTTIYMSGADIHVSPNGEFLYVSNRGQNSMVIYRIDPLLGTLTFIGYEPTGERPVNFRLDQAGAFLFVANSNDDTVFIFRRDQRTGLLERVREVAIPSPSSITQVTLD